MKKTRGFTLAEVLITLAIIGIVAAITLPSLLVNVNEKAWDAQKKALHARLAQAIGQMNTLGGYGQFETDDDGAATTDTAAESFILDALSKVYKINNICGPDKLSSCGIPSKITTLNGTSELIFPTKMSELNPALLTFVNGITSKSGTMVDTKAAAFETVNGESVAVFYNPYCGSDEDWSLHIQNKVCVNFIYDLNGASGPNQVGKDVGFITALYRKNPIVVAPSSYAADAARSPSYSADSAKLDAASVCKAQGGDLRLPNRDELASMFVNRILINASEDNYWSSSIQSIGENGLAWYIYFHNGHRINYLRTETQSVRCVYQ